MGSRIIKKSIDVRIALLWLSSYLLALIYFFVNLIVIVPDWCWQPHEFWFEPGYIFNPFAGFLSVFLFLISWSVYEMTFIFKAGQSKLTSSILIASILSLLIGCIATHYTNYQMMKIAQGKIEYSNYWYKYYGQDTLNRIATFTADLRPALILEPFDIPSYDEYLYDHSCAIGIERWAVAEEVFNTYDNMWEEAIRERDLNKIKAGLEERFGLSERNE